MPTFLTQEWLDDERARLAGVPTRPGTSFRVQRVVTGAPGGEVRAVTTIADGVPVASALGGDDTAEITLTLGYADARRVLLGEADLNAAFISGRMKVAGPTGPLLELLALSQQPAWVTAREALAAATDV